MLHSFTECFSILSLLCCVGRVFFRHVDRMLLRWYFVVLIGCCSWANPGCSTYARNNTRPRIHRRLSVKKRLLSYRYVCRYNNGSADVSYTRWVEYVPRRYQTNPRYVYRPVYSFTPFKDRTLRCGIGHRSDIYVSVYCQSRLVWSTYFI